MAIRAVLARRLCNDQRTAVLETAILPIKLSAHIMAQNTAFEADTLRYAPLSRRASDLLSLFCILMSSLYSDAQHSVEFHLNL